MQWTKTWTITLALLSVLLVTTSFAQDQATGTPIFRASKIIGSDVRNPQGENLGDIQDIVIDPQTGRIAYAVLASGGFLGLGEKYFAVPWEALTPQAGTTTGRERFILNIDRDRLANAPSFDKNNWPNVADRSWEQQVYAFYNVTPYWMQQPSSMQAAATAGMQPNATALIGATVQNVDPNSRTLRFTTNNNELVEMQAPAAVLNQLQAGDRVEVVIRKNNMATPTAPGQPAEQPAR